MSMNDFETAVELIAEMSDADFSGEQSESLIELAEKTLGVRFPPTYRRFLRRYGCGGFGGYEFYGVVKDDFENSGIPDAIWLTLRYRKKTNLPQSMIFIGHSGYGPYYAIDLSQKTPEGDSPVIEWWPGAPDAEGNGQVIATDFGAFLLEQARWAIEN